MKRLALYLFIASALIIAVVLILLRPSKYPAHDYYGLNPFAATKRENYNAANRAFRVISLTTHPDKTTDPVEHEKFYEAERYLSALNSERDQAEEAAALRTR